MTDTIRVEGLVLRMTLGIEDWERADRQDVIIDWEIVSDLEPACQSDRVEDTLNYRTANKAVLALQALEGVKTAERLARLAVDALLAQPRALEATVRVTKPGALRFADSVSVEITRSRDE